MWDKKGSNGAYYHVTSQGNERQKICWEDSDYHTFLEKLAASLAAYNVKRGQAFQEI